MLGVGSLFKVDPETGKRVLLPLPKEYHPISTKTMTTKKKSTEKRKLLAITPLKLTSADWEDSPAKQSKARKVDNNSVEQKKCVNYPPLLDMEEVEEELINKKACLNGYPFRTPNKPVINFTKNTRSTLTKKAKLEKKNPSKKLMDKTPESVSSNETEFLELEKMCCTDEPEKDKNQSPISSVCNLLESTVLNSVKKCKSENVTDIQSGIDAIESILEENTRCFEQYKIKQEEYVTNLSNIINKNNHEICKILDKLRSSSANTETDNKENRPIGNRRSTRLSNKSPVSVNKNKITVSPVILKSGDLRRTALTKNLVAKTQRYEIQSPRIQKALNMYNSMRSDISVLATPKLDRNGGLTESPRSSNVSRTLSRRVQSQCLLLQDTPIHK
ncbi:hypothetical protein NQ317_006364 [Molorchus minor]|uniref:Uncharacterized protein n=1 Tax=Molorchus minor TaxID=1323400 RepID=A0ABQ9JN33_9CUCU|nr:hypothetical protein NQ317_006364 [Molorchus minor]